MPTSATPIITAFAGSLRRESFNKKLVACAAAGAKAAGADVRVIDLAEFPLPIYDGDLEEREGIPAHAKSLKKLLRESHGLLISSPEYNSSVSAALKNMIDWVSRPARPGEPPEPPLASFAGKVAGIMAASPGNLGGLRGLVHLRAILSNIQVLVLPDQIALHQAQAAFDEHAQLKDPKHRETAERIGARVATVAAKLM
jgi:chromate reductase, NAD(P)H dehydrogenase (quinone)